MPGQPAPKGLHKAPGARKANRHPEEGTKMAENEGPARAPMIEAARLYSRTSPKGTEYLTGRLGGLKLLIWKKRDGDEGDHSHVMMVTTPAPREGGR